ncbi:MAG TPA: anthranilate phosphoribosyltransferase [Verrucomicrobiales bacterium]|nr:anthranilate phosphoribosyltransferase [Verrucomicrobiales bacterium]
MLNSLFKKLGSGTALSPTEVGLAVADLTDESVPAAIKADFLVELARKGETADEIAAFAAELRERSIRLPFDAETRSREMLDVCGTGGDHLGTFNISTAAAIVVASAGVTVAKHGNRAITSKAGSADVLEALGIPIDLKPEAAAQALKEHHFAFLFAPHYHPAFKHIVPARKLCAERGQRTIFNFLGPLLNPARPTCQLIGVPRPDLCEPMARVLQGLGIRRGMVVSGRVGDKHLDELSILGSSEIAEFYQDRGFARSVLDAADFPVQPAQLGDLVGGDRDANAAIIRAILAGEDRGPKRDAVLLNAGAALFVAGRTKSIGEGWEQAGRQIDSGAAEQKLKTLAGQGKG